MAEFRDHKQRAAIAEDGSQLDCICSSAASDPASGSAATKPRLSRLETQSKDEGAAQPPPRDRGWPAYRLLVAATIVSAIPCGIYLSFGVFHAYYATDPLFPSTNNTAWIGVLSSGVPYLGAPLIVYICTHTTWTRIHFIWTGWLLGVISQLGAAYSRTIPALIVNQGLLYGVSILLADNPILLVVNTWFVRKRGVAYGIVFGMSDVCAVGWSFLAQWLLNAYGLRTTFLVFAIIMLALPGPCILLLRERGSSTIWKRSTLSTQPGSDLAAEVLTVPGSPILAKVRSTTHASTTTPIPDNHGARASNSSGKDGTSPSQAPVVALVNGTPTPATTKPRPRFYRRPIFYILALSNLSQALAFYLPIIYLPTYVSSLPSYSSTTTTTNTTTTAPSSPSHPTGALHLSLLNASQIAGELLFGYASDHLSPALLAALSSSLASLSVFCLWGFAPRADSPQLYAFALLFGFSGAGFVALWARMGLLFGEGDAQMVFGALCAGRGLGGVAGGPVSEVVLGRWSGDGSGSGSGSAGWAAAAGGRWRGLVLLVGGCMAVSAVLAAVGVVVLGMEQRRFRARKTGEGTVSGNESAAKWSWVWAERDGEDDEVIVGDDGAGTVQGKDAMVLQDVGNGGGLRRWLRWLRPSREA